MATSPSSKLENNDGVPLSVLEFLRVDNAVNMSDEQSEFIDSFAHHSGNLLDQTLMLPMVEPFGVFPSPSTLSEPFLTNEGVFDHAFSEPRSGAEVDPSGVNPHDAAFINSITLTQTPPSLPPPSNHPIPSPSPLMLSNEGEAPAQRSRTGYLTISVVGMDGEIIGGQVCGSMIAASPVQVVGGAIIVAANDGKDSASSKPSSSDHQSEALLLELNKQISSLSQEWQARLVEHNRDIETKVNEKEKELRQVKKELEETRKLLNQTRQELQETRLTISTNQNLLMQLFERLNIVNPPPPPPHSSTNNPPSSL